MSFIYCPNVTSDLLLNFIVCIARYSPHFLFCICIHLSLDRPRYLIRVTMYLDCQLLKPSFITVILSPPHIPWSAFHSLYLTSLFSWISFPPTIYVTYLHWSLPWIDQGIFCQYILSLSIVKAISLYSLICIDLLSVFSPLFMTCISLIASHIVILTKLIIPNSPSYVSALLFALDRPLAFPRQSS